MRVVIGIDPHKRSNTAVVLDREEQVLARQRFDNDREGHRALRAFGRRWADRTWAVEGARGVGLGLAQRLAADGETVLNVPAKLSARVRALGGGSGRKTDDTDAYAVAVAGLRGRGLQLVHVDDTVAVLRLLSERRQRLKRKLSDALQLVEQRIMTVDAKLKAAAKRIAEVFKEHVRLAQQPDDAAGGREQPPGDVVTQALTVGPVRTVGGDSGIQRDWPNPGSQLFGQVTSRTHRAGRYARLHPGVSTRLTERGAIPGDREAATKRAYHRPAAARLCDGRFLLLQPADRRRARGRVRCGPRAETGAGYRPRDQVYNATVEGDDCEAVLTGTALAVP